MIAEFPDVLKDSFQDPSKGHSVGWDGLEDGFDED
jgi:hypothetical protein